MSAVLEDAAAPVSAGKPSLIARAANGLANSWFGPTSPIVPAMCRLLIYGYTLQLTHHADRWLATRKTLWYPTTYFAFFDIPLFDEAVVDGLMLVNLIACWAAFLGLYYRFAAPVVALTCLYLLGMQNNFGKVDHSQNALMLSLIVMVFARAADVWSVDAWRRGWRPGHVMPKNAAYRWPQQMILLIVVLMYGAAGWSKFDRHGWQWGLSDNLRNLWLSHQFTKNPPTRIGVWLAEYPTVYKGMGLSSLMLELCAPLALLHRWLRALIVPGLMALQLGIYLTMGVVFRAMIPVFLCLLPWQTIAATVTPLVLELKRRWQTKP